MGQGQPGPPGKDGRDGSDGKDAAIDYSVLQPKVKDLLVNDTNFKNSINAFLKENAVLFKGEKGLVEFKSLSSDEQSALVATMAANNLDNFVNRLAQNATLQGALIATLKTLPEFKGSPGKNGANGKDGINGNNGRDGIDGKPGKPGSSFDSPASMDFLKNSVMWCADGDLCKMPQGKRGLDWGYGASKIYDDAQLKIESDDNIFMRVGGENVADFTKDNLLIFGSKYLQFGQDYDREGSAGQIGYGRHDGGVNGSLNIVGGGKNGQKRRVRIWDTLQVGDWTLNADDGHLRIFHGGDQKFVIHNDGNLWSKTQGWVARGN